MSIFPAVGVYSKAKVERIITKTTKFKKYSYTQKTAKQVDLYSIKLYNNHVMAYRVVDLFAGCGGMSLGFQTAGFNVVAAFDNWKPAINTYRRNFSHPIFDRDLSCLSVVQEISDFSPDIIIGGPPCQDFSSAGYRDEKLGRAVLSKVYADIVTAIKPVYFVMENVPNIKKSKIYSYVKTKFRSAGYGLTEAVLNASLCGVPQKRKRLFLIGKIGADDDFLLNYLTKHLSAKPMSVYDYLGNSLNTEYYFRIPRSYNRRAIFSIYEPSATIRGVERPIPPHYKKHKNDPVDISDKVRSLTPKERSFIQTFPESFVFDDSVTNLNQMIGNAVPVELAKFVALRILEFDQQKEEPDETTKYC